MAAPLLARQVLIFTGAASHWLSCGPSHAPSRRALPAVGGRRLPLIRRRSAARSPALGWGSVEWSPRPALRWEKSQGCQCGSQSAGPLLPVRPHDVSGGAVGSLTAFLPLQAGKEPGDRRAGVPRHSALIGAGVMTVSQVSVCERAPWRSGAGSRLTAPGTALAIGDAERLSEERCRRKGSVCPPGS